MRAILLIIIAGLFCSCSREYCLTPLVGGAVIYGDTAAIAADTQLILVSYKKDGKFSTPLVTTYFKPDTVNGMHHNRYVVGFPYPGSTSADDPALDFDWIITLKPSGRTYKLKDVNSQNRHIRTHGEIKENCVNTITYVANDSLYSASSEPVESASANLTIGIKY